MSDRLDRGAERRFRAAAGEEYASHYEALNPEGGSERAYGDAREWLERELAPLLPARRDALLVEVGSGHGHLLRFLLEAGYRRVGAVDRSEALLAGVRERLGARLEFACLADGFELLADNPGHFDGVILFDVLEHVPPGEGLAAMRAVHRALRPGGRVVLRTPNMASLFGAYSRYIDLTHRQGFTEFSLAQLLRGAGFRDPRLHLPEPWGGRRRVLRRRLLRWLQLKLLAWQERTVPRCVDKNLVAWADKDA